MQILGVANAIRQMDIEARWRLLAGVIVELVDGKREYRKIAGEHGRRAVSVVHIAIHHHRLQDGFLVLQGSDGDGDVVDRAEALAVTGERVVESTAHVEADAAREGVPRSQYRAPGRQPERFHHLP